MASDAAQPGVHHELQALSTGALHMTIYDLLAHAYNRVAIQYYHDEGRALLADALSAPPPQVASTLPAALQREVVNALLADTARALATYFGFAEMNFVLLDHERQIYTLHTREGVFFPHFQPGAYTQPFGTGLLGQCHLERRTVLVNDVSTAPEYVRNDAAVRAELCVPVMLGDETLAIIDSGAYTVNAFTSAHAAFIEGCARYLAPAIADPLGFLQAWRPELVRGTNALAPLAQSLNFLYTWHEEWRARFAQLYREAAQRNAELTALADLSATLGASLQLDTILTKTVAKVAELLACQVSWILLPGDDGRLRVRALHGGTVAGLLGAGIALDRSPQSRVFASGAPLITNDVAQTPRSSFDWAFCQRNGVAHYATVPLRARERSIGVMNVGRAHGFADLTEQDVRLLSAFASQIALAIENATLYDQSRLLGAAEERARVTRDLHDTLAHSMLSIVRQLEEIEASAHESPTTLRDRLRRARLLARQSLDEARRSVLNLPPAALEYTTLHEALERNVSAWSAETGVKARFERKGHPAALAPGVQRELLMMTREALRNVARHAAASSVSVVLQFGPAGLRLIIGDDGVGFSVESLVADGVAPATHKATQAAGGDSAYGQIIGGVGLRGMRERAQLLGGWLQIESAPGWGARVVLTLPPAALEPIRREYIALDVSESPLGVATDTAPAGETLVSGVEPDSAEGNISPITSAQQTDVATTTGLPLMQRRPPVSAESPLARQPADVGRGERQREGQTITVALADDHPATREGLRASLDATPGLRVVGVAGDARGAVALAHERAPDVMLLDMRLPDTDGLAALEEIRALASATQVIICTAFADDANIAAALRAGAIGYLSKETPIPQLIEAIRLAATGRPVFSPDIAARIHERAGLLVNPTVGRLTPREHETLEMLAQGMRYHAIAERLGVSAATVKFHVLNLYQKLQSSSRMEAINQARVWGLLR